MSFKVIQGDCTKELDRLNTNIDLTFLDPPFNQNKDYNYHNDNLPDAKYWEMMTTVSEGIYEVTSKGGAIYFMQREKNAESVLKCLKETGWIFQNLIIWKKKTSAVPCSNKFGKHYQIIAFATKGAAPRVFNRLRINPPLPSNYKFDRENGVYLTDVWDDIRELTAGYFAGDEALRKSSGDKFHKQQSPLALLLRIILSSTKIGDTVLDPFAGTGTTLVVAEQVGRKSIGIEIDPNNVQCIESRLEVIRESDNIQKFQKDYIYTENLNGIWDVGLDNSAKRHKNKTLSLFKN